MGFNKSSSKTNPTTSYVDPTQAGYLSQLYSQSLGALPGVQEQIGQIQPQAMQTLQGMMNPGINPQLQAYMGDVSQNLQNNLLPQIAGGANQAQQLGGSRMGLAQGQAIQGANRDITNMAANLYSQDMNRALQAANMSGDIAGMGMRPYMDYRQVLGPTNILQSGGGGKSSSFGLSL